MVYVFDLYKRVITPCIFLLSLMSIFTVFCISQCRSVNINCHYSRGFQEVDSVVHPAFHRKLNNLQYSLAHVVNSEFQKSHRGRNDSNTADHKRIVSLEYIGDLLDSLVGSELITLDQNDYSSRCRDARRLLLKAFETLLQQNAVLGRDDKEGMNDVHISDINISLIVLENAMIATVGKYLALTMNNIHGDNTWFFFKGTNRVSKEEQEVRLSNLVKLLLSLESYMHKQFKDIVNSYKLSFVSKMFANNKDSVLQLTDEQFIKRLHNEFNLTANNIVPKCFKHLRKGKESIKDFLRYVANADSRLKDSINVLINEKVDPHLLDEFSQRISNWNANNDVEEFRMLLSKLHQCAKESLQKQLAVTTKKDNLMKVISSQQQQIDICQKQLGMQSQNYSPISYGFSYRMPNTNLNVTGSYQR
eukprot:XP_001610923.1 hypothetical protein [Babesia bovis T2Bo]